MVNRTIKKSRQEGSTLVEFAIGASVFLLAMFAVIEFGRALWVHNALADAARRAARYAVNQPASTPAGVPTSGTNVGPSTAAIRNVGVYGNPGGTGAAMVPNLDPTTNIDVTYSNFGVGQGTVSVSITDYQHQFVVPIIGTTITMPDYQTTLTGESAGVVVPIP
ncbi:MAG: TadE family protein [Pyrinomonadaceae bacterium]